MCGNATDRKKRNCGRIVRLNEAVYTAGPVACHWAGAIKPESAENAKNAEKA